MVPINGMDNLQKDDSRQAHLEVVNEVEKCLTGEAPGESSSEQALNPEVIVAEAVSELCTDYVAGSIINVALNLQEIMDNVNTQNYNRAFNPSSVLHLSKFSDLLSFDDAMEINNDPNINTHIEDLERHLAGFRLEIDHISKDGDCAFRSIIRQTLKLDLKEKKELEHHLRSLKLLSGCEDEDTFTLPQLFVEELLRGEEEYSGFLSETSTLNDRANEFKIRGVFDREIGDLTMKVCSNVLRIPIMIITSSRSTPVVPFVPDRSLSNTPIYIAFHYYGAGHYDATSNKGDPGM